MSAEGIKKIIYATTEAEAKKEQGWVTVTC